MGNILNPSPGDLADRQTILLVKLAHCGVEGDTGYAPKSEQLMEQSTQKSVSRTVIEKTEIDIQPFLVEHDGIQQRLKLDWFPKIPDDSGDKFDALQEELLTVNRILWDLEDQARVLRSAPAKQTQLVEKRASETLFAITEYNDKRAALVKRINALWNINLQEKMY